MTGWYDLSKDELVQRCKEGAFAYSEDELRALLPPKGGFEHL